MWGIIATWRMALEGVEEATAQLQAGETAGQAMVHAIAMTEDCPHYKSVGYGALPNVQMQVELDAAYMDGDTMQVGCVGALQDFPNPILIAKELSTYSVNNFLVGCGAEAFAQKQGFPRKNMLTEEAKRQYREQLHKKQEELKPYIGHDTVGMVALDQRNSMSAGTSTSGLFMKHPGRLGDSPLIGSGFYVDSEIGGATATGLGEDLMKGCPSYEIVRLMREGMHPQQACEQTIAYLTARLKKHRPEVGDMSVIAMNAAGEWGAASTIAQFSFVVATETKEPTVYLCTRHADGICTHQKADQAWLDHYLCQKQADLVTY